MQSRLGGQIEEERGAAGSRLIGATLWLAPVAVLLLTGAFIAILVEFDADPDYPYLLNALGLLELRTPALVYHPGTPVQIVGGAIIGVVWLLRLPFAGLALPRHDVLLHPELYLRCIAAGFAVFNAAAIHYLGSRIHQATRSVLPALVAQFSILLSFPVALSFPRATPEPFLIGLTALLCAVLVAPLFARESFRESYRHSVLLGAIVGACVAAKFTAAPLCLAVLFLRERRMQLAAGAAAVAAFFVCTLPAMPHYRLMAIWVRDLLTHTGQYGTGDAGIPSAGEWLANLESLVRPGLGLLLTLAGCGVFLAWRVVEHFSEKWSPVLREKMRPFKESRVSFPDRSDLGRLFLIAALIIVAGIVAVAKHPGARYLVPLCAIAALANAGLVEAARHIKLRFRTAPLAAIGLAFAAASANAVSLTVDWLEGSNAIIRSNLALIRTAQASGCFLVPYYDANIQEFKEMFGVGWASRFYRDDLLHLYPDSLSYDPFSVPGRFWSFAGLVPSDDALAEIAAHPCTDLVGSAAIFGDNIGLSPSVLELIGQTEPRPPYYDHLPIAIHRLKLPPGANWNDITRAKPN
jgi:hypothetical protein